MRLTTKTADLELRVDEHISFINKEVVLFGHR